MENQSESLEYSQKSFGMMEHFSLTFIPINYALCYAYMTERDLSLNAEFDQILTTTGTCTPLIAESLVFQYVFNNRRSSWESPEGITTIVDAVSDYVETAVVDGHQFAGTLTAFQDRFGSVQDVSDKERLYNDVMRAASHLADNNAQYNHLLENTQSEIERLREKIKHMEDQVHYDAMTTLFNRAAFDKQLDQLMGNREVGKALCLIMIDIDLFKQYNDEYGHLMGDRVLGQIGQLIGSLCQDNAIAARYGGEEFVIIMSGRPWINRLSSPKPSAARSRISI